MAKFQKQNLGLTQKPDKMFVPKTIDDGELGQEIILTLQISPRKPLHRHLQILILEVASIHHSITALPQLVLPIEVVSRLLQILEFELPWSPRQFRQCP